MSSVVGEIIHRAKKAQQHYEMHADQKDYDMAALAVAWALMEPARNKELSTQAVQQTGLGKIDDKIIKNHRKTLGLLRDIENVKTKNIIEDSPTSGITKIARPIGVIGAVVPSTNPLATPVNNIINALKCGNAIILSPSPKGGEVCRRLLQYIHAELKKVNIDPDLVQMLPLPATKENTQELMEKVDLLVVTGSQDNVRRAYSSGSPAIGVGSGNVSVIVDETADLQATAEKIIASKTFDNSTSCSSENALIIVDEIYDEFLKILADEGALIVQKKNEHEIRAQIRPHDNKLNNKILAQDIDVVLEQLGLEKSSSAVKVVAVESDQVDKTNPLCNEKMSLVLGVFKAKDFSHAKAIADQIFTVLGAGHSIGLHTSLDDRTYELASQLPTCRVIVNQAHCFATGGAFNNGMKFSLSMGCGSWGGNSIDDNLHYKHFMNTTKIIRPIEGAEPELADIFSEYWQAVEH